MTAHESRPASSGGRNEGEMFASGASRQTSTGPELRARLAEIRRHHSDDRPCSMTNDECLLLSVVSRVEALVVDPNKQGVRHVPIARQVREALGLETP